jgi:hypothetical protein
MLASYGYLEDLASIQLEHLVRVLFVCLSSPPTYTTYHSPPTYPCKGVMNDMWVLDLNATQQGNASWEFVSGSLEKNQPGDISTPSSREGSVYWVDPVSGSLWLFGGRSRDSPLNDLWHFSPDTRVWTRIAQNSTEGSFGDLGVDSPGMYTYTFKLRPPTSYALPCAFW